MKMKLALLMAAILLGGMMVTPAIAQDFVPPTPPPPAAPGMGYGHGHGQGFGQQMMEKLNLSREQKEQLRSLRTLHRKEMIPLRADIKVAEIELREMIHNDAQGSEIDRKIEAIGRMRTEIEKKKVSHRVKMRSLLTPEQREKMEDCRGFGGHRQEGRHGTGKGGQHHPKARSHHRF
ncbi:MAG: periplasmic heavy metal sensor [candidate division Zixibacteria bacterium]|nr:periplasmic heavy metal sensor [candidate division Zixibacteria bacterium]